jgi:hypothetical protein
MLAVIETMKNARMTTGAYGTRGLLRTLGCLI